MTIKRVINILSVASAIFFTYAVWLFTGDVESQTNKDDIVWLTGTSTFKVEEGETKDLWFRAEINNKPIGYAHYQRMTSGNKYIVFATTDMIFKIMGENRRIKNTVKALFTLDYKPIRFSLSVDAQPALLNIKGVVSGKKIDLFIDSGGTESVEKIELDEEPSLGLFSGEKLAKEGFEVGKKYREAVFDPQTMSGMPVEMEVIAHEQITIDGTPESAWRVREKSKEGVFEEWLDDNGDPLISTGPLGIKLVKTIRGQAMRALKNAGGEDITLLAKVSVAQNFPDPVKLKLLKLKLGGVPFNDFEIASFRQNWNKETGELTITREQVDAIKPVNLPIADKAYSEYLKPSPFMQSDDPGIIKQAKSIVGEEKKAAEAARLISQWVNKSLLKESVIGIPSAREVLKTKRGDCGEHAALFVALAQAAGIPARFAAGLVSMGGDFFYHAWGEIYAGEWISVDPTFNQFPADVSHIRFITGDADKQVVISQLLGKITIDVMGFEELPATGSQQSVKTGEK